jgi:hypothetical protein
MALVEETEGGEKADLALVPIPCAVERPDYFHSSTSPLRSARMAVASDMSRY